ncbi:hypothetical protein L2E82_17056 [Cichorium intybus]|uniref:Uncharacterized protein n=1 Tax=Cichorium intybus TaxID=13427 RepID=A0ACB9F7S2_CICIN|nr:hypothetical protein L2E82_17056 [Cichorium intybus]
MDNHKGKRVLDYSEKASDDTKLHFISYELNSNDLQIDNDQIQTMKPNTAQDDQCVAGLSHDHVKLGEYLEELKKLKTKSAVDYDLIEFVNKQSNYEIALGVIVPYTVQIHNPSNIRIKGCARRGK